MSKGLVSLKRALISVSEKRGIKQLAKSLEKNGTEIISTGGTADYLRGAGLAVKEVSNITNFPELMDGRLKTLHPNIHGGLLAMRDNKDHLVSLQKYNIPEIDLLVVNLYPFEKTITEVKELSEIVEQIDVGGPAMIRAAAKNFKFVTVLVDVEDYESLLNEISENDGCTSFQYRKALAEVAFSRTAEYDAVISQWMLGQTQKKMPRRFVTAAKLERNLRYGENPHQDAAYYRNSFFEDLFSSSVLHQGKDLSYNNLSDINCATQLLYEFENEPGVMVAIIKHGNACGLAVRDTSSDAYIAAYDSDRSSAFGGVIVINETIDKKTAVLISSIFSEIVLAPAVDQDAKKIFSKKKNLRLITWSKNQTFENTALSFRQVLGGVLLQDYDNKKVLKDELRIVTNKKPSDLELADMMFAWKVAKHLKSNAVVFARNMRTVGIGAGQMSRVDSAKIATFKAQAMGEELGYKKSCSYGAVAASDAFFPFADGIYQLAKAGISAVIQPGGSIKDEEVIEAANVSDIAMVFTNLRHFNH